MTKKKSEVTKVKVQWIEFENLKTGLKIEKINFYEREDTAVCILFFIIF